MSKDGGPAFPSNSYDGLDSGMTLRDYFAAAVLPEMIRGRDENTTIAVAAAISVRAAYIYADAMLAERDK